jgi:hypothetical protein
VGRRLIAGLALGLLLLVATPALAFHARSGGAPRVQFRPADNRRAKASLLRRSDLIATFRRDPRGGGVPMIPHCQGFPGDRSGITITGYAKSAFTDGVDVMGSSSTVFRSDADLVRYWATTVRPRFATCDASAIRRSLGRGVKATTLFAKQLRLGPTGTQRSAAFRTITRVSRRGHTPVDWYQTVVFLGEGRGLAAIKIGYANQPCNCHNGLARRLARRLIAANRG